MHTIFSTQSNKKAVIRIVDAVVAALVKLSIAYSYFGKTIFRIWIDFKLFGIFVQQLIVWSSHFCSLVALFFVWAVELADLSHLQWSVSQRHYEISFCMCVTESWRSQNISFNENTSSGHNYLLKESRHCLVGGNLLNYRIGLTVLQTLKFYGHD